MVLDATWVNVTEVVLEDTDVSKALIEYISTQQIHHFVVGVTNKNAAHKVSLSSFSLCMKFMIR